ncbi:hypothetical protein C454_18379 [Haloferax gibbonsii ATCC 33959]|uniref:Uncharacterized protein n=1 Tax=Haloferax gibbonsii (strain ATCC 33959 / DSM 4427 / JCM 8863 / NBRC 102184 / NCIMB 2188 / Ma 2.38) TaxID=1227459 RepID=M0GVL9_HALGM|nr:hypothetical protein [Haloferax gibbonsii]ELZ76291.1 hypothetical protein C454_18379 [Haloferax gibbonsii ATCC 33959]
MDLDALEAFEGPTTLRIFMFLLMLTVMLVFVGAVLSVTHDIELVETIGLSLAHNTMGLLRSAGVIAFLILLGKVVVFALQFAE